MSDPGTPWGEIAAAVGTAIAASLAGVFGLRRARGDHDATPAPRGPGVATVRLETQRERFEALRTRVHEIEEDVAELRSDVAVLKDRGER